ncbi:helix-turn-helix domain-containing protein [Rhodopseudomonas sp. RCAM05734]|uniref:helix-turn-helix domain-containing protein n=1 Tax=Rhodopseudomonas sp. RCAM05734 TaxID=3457549 RepID=UPI004044CB19
MGVALGGHNQNHPAGLASHLNDMGEPMFPSQARLSRMCSLSERAVIAHLHIAEQAGWIAPRKRDLRAANGLRTSTSPLGQMGCASGVGCRLLEAACQRS